MPRDLVEVNPELLARAAKLQKPHLRKRYKYKDKIPTINKTLQKDNKFLQKNQLKKYDKYLKNLK